MPRIPKLRRSPATVVAILALVAGLAGTAVAVGGLTGKQKKQVRKIATKVFNKNIGGASVAHASTADNATNAKNANTAKTANSAKTADTAKTAKTANDAEKLGGLSASKYQQVIQGACPKNGAYEAIGSDGSAACVIPVVPIVIQHTAGEPLMGVSAGAGLEVRSVCHDGATVEVIFRNGGASSGTLNWFYANKLGEVKASGAVLNSGNEEPFGYSTNRIEGQFIWSVGSQVVTVNLHAYDGGSFCEIRGTAEGATA